MDGMKSDWSEVVAVEEWSTTVLLSLYGSISCKMDVPGPWLVHVSLSVGWVGRWGGRMDGVLFGGLDPVGQDWYLGFVGVVYGTGKGSFFGGSCMHITTV